MNALIKYLSAAEHEPSLLEKLHGLIGKAGKAAKSHPEVTAALAGGAAGYGAHELEDELGDHDEDDDDSMLHKYKKSRG